MWILSPDLWKDSQFRDLILFLTELLVFPGVKFLIKNMVTGTKSYLWEACMEKILKKEKETIENLQLLLEAFLNF